MESDGAAAREVIVAILEENIDGNMLDHGEKIVIGWDLKYLNGCLMLIFHDGHWCHMSLLSPEEWNSMDWFEVEGKIFTGNGFLP